MYLYHEREPSNNRAKLCLWTTRQRLAIEQIAAGTNAIIFSTNTGQVYTANLDKLSSTNKKTEYGKCEKSRRQIDYDGLDLFLVSRRIFLSLNLRSLSLSNKSHWSI